MLRPDAFTIALDGILRLVISVGNGIDDGFIDRNCWKLRLLSKSTTLFPVLISFKEGGFTKECPGGTNLFGDRSSKILVE